MLEIVNFWRLCEFFYYLDFYCYYVLNFASFVYGVENGVPLQFKFLEKKNLNFVWVH